MPKKSCFSRTSYRFLQLSCSVRCSEMIIRCAFIPIEFRRKFCRKCPYIRPKPSSEESYSASGCLFGGVFFLGSIFAVIFGIFGSSYGPSDSISQSSWIALGIGSILFVSGMVYFTWYLLRDAFKSRIKKSKQNE